MTNAASVFDAWAADGRDAGMEQDHGDVVAQVVESMGIKPGEMIIDLGCGNGWATRLLAKQAPGSQAIGIDCAPGMIARAEELHSYTIRARYELMPFEALDFPDARFERAFSMEALYYAADLEQALAELARVLKPGGEANLVLDYFGERPGQDSWPEGIGLTMNRKSEAEWIAALQAAGFAEVEARRVVDRRGPTPEADFVAGPWCPDHATHVAAHAAGSLWLIARKSA